MCEDFPCCGHESGCCPDYDESGRQLNMKCVCGKPLPINNRFSICESCMNQDDIPEYPDHYYDQEMRDETGLDDIFEDYQGPDNPGASDEALLDDAPERVRGSEQSGGSEGDSPS